MTPDVSPLAFVVAGGALALCVAALCVRRIIIGTRLQASERVISPDPQELRKALDEHRTAYDERLAELSRNLESLSLSLGRDGLSEGRLNLSFRAQAIQLLRSGMAPDTTAASTGVPRSDIRLLARVAEVLQSDKDPCALKTIG